MLQFFGSPLGQKVAAEIPKISKEVQFATRNVSGRAARAAWQEFHAQNSDSQAKLSFAGRRRWQQGQNPDGSTQQAQADPQQP